MTELFSEIQVIQSKIYSIRGMNVMLDRDLAALYQVETRYLNKVVKRNSERFSDDFMFQLTKPEVENLMFQIGTSNWGGTRKLPFVFTEYGALMLASVLRSEYAIKVNQVIIKAFVELRKVIALQPEYELLREKIKRIELDVKDIRSNNFVENQQVSGKMTHLSREFLSLRENVQQFSELLDRFQNAHVIIKRPDELLEG